MDEKGEVDIPIKGMHEFLNQDNYEWGKYPYTPTTYLEEINMLNYDPMLVYTHFKRTCLWQELVVP